MTFFRVGILVSVVAVRICFFVLESVRLGGDVWEMDRVPRNTAGDSIVSVVVGVSNIFFRLTANESDFLGLWMVDIPFVTNVFDEGFALLLFVGCLDFFVFLTMDFLIVLLPEKRVLFRFESTVIVVESSPVSTAGTFGGVKNDERDAKTLDSFWKRLFCDGGGSISTVTKAALVGGGGGGGKGSVTLNLGVISGGVVGGSGDNIAFMK